MEQEESLDRLSRSLKDVLTLMEKVELVSAGFQSLTEAMNMGAIYH